MALGFLVALLESFGGKGTPGAAVEDGLGDRLKVASLEALLVALTAVRRVKVRWEERLAA